MINFQKLGLLLLAFNLARAATGAEPDSKPNVVIIFADDLGYGDLSCYGQKNYSTPRLDQMAREGTKLTEFYVASPACSPSRAALLTGQYPSRSGVQNVLGPKAKNGLDNQYPNLPQLLKQAGYATALVGKWHLGTLPQYHPLKKGFDHFFGLPYSNDMKPSPLFRQNKVVEQPANQETLTRRYTEDALAFIDDSTSAGKPFFLYFAHTFPHVPLHVSEKFAGKSGAGLYGDVVTELDWSVGQVLDHLTARGLEKNTLVIFTSDNGPWLIKGDQAGVTGGLRGSKGTDYEGGVREPFIAWWPGNIPAGKVVEEPAITLDMLPTIAKLAGVETSATKAISSGKSPYEGRDIWPVISRGESVGERTFFFPDYYAKVSAGSIRKGDFKLVSGREKTAKFDARTTELFNLKQDPFEKHDISAEHPDLVKELSRELLEKRQEFSAENEWGKPRR